MTRHALPALVSLIITAGAVTANTGTVFRDLDPETSDLSAYRWSDRPVVIFAPSPDDPKLKQALAALHLADAGLHDRDIVVLTDTDPAADGVLRQKMEAEGFTMILVGKDGGVKLRTEDAILSPDQLFTEVDQMPMRQREMLED